MKAGEPDLEKEQELRMGKHLEGQAGTDPSLKQVMLWNCLVQTLPWHWALSAPAPGPHSSLWTHSPGTTLLSYWIVPQLPLHFNFCSLKIQNPRQAQLTGWSEAVDLKPRCPEQEEGEPPRSTLTSAMWGPCEQDVLNLAKACESREP